VKNVLVVPTLPSFPAIDDRTEDRLALLGGLTFVEGATSGWAARDLLGWFKTYGPALGRTAAPASVSDAVVGSIALLPGARLVGDKVARPDDLPKLLAMSRWRVVVTLRGLLSVPCDDRFLQAAIFADRVRREGSVWRAQPRDTDLLSDVVLSLFAVDASTQCRTTLRSRSPHDGFSRAIVSSCSTRSACERGQHPGIEWCQSHRHRKS